MLSSSSNGPNFKVLSSSGQCGLERVCVAPRISELVPRMISKTAGVAVESKEATHKARTSAKPSNLMLSKPPFWSTRRRMANTWALICEILP
jgi:hypothetical protein